jgi:hypothetical protein
MIIRQGAECPENRGFLRENALDDFTRFGQDMQAQNCAAQHQFV